MQNLKKIGIVFAILVVVIVVAVAFRSYWLDALSGFIIWVQTQIGFDKDQAFNLAEFLGGGNSSGGNTTP